MKAGGDAVRLKCSTGHHGEGVGHFIVRFVLLHPPYRGIAQRCGQQSSHFQGGSSSPPGGMRGGGFHLQVDAEHNSRYFGTAQRRAGYNGLWSS